MIINIRNKKQDQAEHGDVYIGRGPGKVHMVSPGMTWKAEGYLGNPIIIGGTCINCEQIHVTGGSTLLCFNTLLQAKLMLNADFREEMESWREFALDPRNDERTLNLVCWCAPEPCHGEVIRDYLRNERGRIGFTRKLGVYAWMSNMAPYQVQYKGQLFRTAEHAYVWEKTDDPAEKITVSNKLSPEAIKKIGRSLTLRSDWEEEKFPIMKQVLMDKVRTNPDLTERLLETGDNELIELTWWHDQTWGVCSCSKHKFQGANRLGKLWMELRQMLKSR